jgi:bla regulator protein blaR1
MITYIIKTILCSGLLILFYYLILEREKIYKFNRVFLLFSVLFSFIIPLVSIKVAQSPAQILETVYPSNSFEYDTVPLQQLSNSNSNINLTHLLLIAYVLVSVYLLTRFIINVSSLILKLKRSRAVTHPDARFILTEDRIVPYSFLKFIFIYNEDYIEGKIEGEILSHELTHVKQKHSYDILFIEFLLVFAWINPVLFLYKRSMQLNHEFLADESVIKEFKESASYQLLLINKALQPEKLQLSSQFNYLLTKKRIIMMSKKGSLRAALLKQISLIPVLFAAVFLFTSRVVAQDNVSTQNQQLTESTQNGVSGELLKEYKDILDKYKKTLKNGIESYSLDLSKEDHERLESIFFQMSKEQQETQIIVFVPASSMLFTKHVPTPEQLISFRDPKIYGVWIDGVRIDNEILKNYKNTDFAIVSVSILLKNATNYGKHVYQVNLWTNSHFQKLNDETMARKDNIIVPRFLAKDSIKRSVTMIGDGSKPKKVL